MVKLCKSNIAFPSIHPSICLAFGHLSIRLSHFLLLLYSFGYMTNSFYRINFGHKTNYLKYMNQSCVIKNKMGFSLPKDHDPSYKMDLNQWDCFGMEEIQLTTWRNLTKLVAWLPLKVRVCKSNIIFLSIWCPSVPCPSACPSIMLSPPKPLCRI